MDLPAPLRAARDAVAARQVFGEPIERHGVTVIPVASVVGGGGGGDDTGEAGQPRNGFGFGLWGRPVAAIEITERGMEWKPAPLDVTGVLMVALMFALPAAFSAWGKRRRR